MNLREQFEKETGRVAYSACYPTGIYVEWLEAKAQKPEVSEEELEAVFERFIGSPRVYKTLQPRLYQSCIDFGKALLSKWQKPLPPVEHYDDPDLDGDDPRTYGLNNG